MIDIKTADRTGHNRAKLEADLSVCDQIAIYIEGCTSDVCVEFWSNCLMEAWSLAVFRLRELEDSQRIEAAR